MRPSCPKGIPSGKTVDCNRSGGSAEGDSRYQSITEFITIYYGTPQEFDQFLKEVETFCNNNEPETFTKIQGQTVSLVSIMGFQGLNIYEKNGNGYRSFTPKSISKIKDKFEKWAKDNSIDLNAPRGKADVNGDLIAKDEVDEFNGIRSITTKHEYGIGTSKFGNQLDSYIIKIEKEELKYYAINFTINDLDECLSKHDGKAMIKLVNDDIIELYQMSDTDCSDSPYGLYYPISRDQGRLSDEETSGLIKVNIEKLKQTPWKIIRVYTAKGHLDFTPSSSGFTDLFFQDHLAALD